MRQRFFSFALFGLAIVAAAVIDEVAVQVDVVFGDAAVPSKAVRVKRVDHHDLEIARPGVVPVGLEPADLRTGACVALNAVGAGDRQQGRCRVVGS